jgi:hypothetical protein
MSNSRNELTGKFSPSSARVKPDTRPAFNRASRGRRTAGLSTERRETLNLWGFAPTGDLSTASLTRLFSTQKRLNAVLRKEARLLQVEVSEVRSVTTEHLRMVNQVILDVSSLGEGVRNPFKDRNLTEAQILSEDLVRRQGKPFSTDEVKKSKPSPSEPVKSHRRWNGSTPSSKLGGQAHLEDLFVLRGPLAKCFHRAVERGYRGPLSRWLRGPHAIRAGAKAREAGINLPPHERWRICAPSSPVYYAVNSCTITKTNLRSGFQNERLSPEITSVVNLRRQAVSVNRLKLSDWPRSGRGLAWPTYPTLGESWSMWLMGRRPIHHEDTSPMEKLHPLKRPLKLVKPGSVARAVSRLVIGVRASVEVPRKFLPHFAYRWGFLILKRRFQLPNGLVKHLSNLWKSQQQALFLRADIRFRDALRRIPGNCHWQLSGFTVPVRQRLSCRLSKRSRPGRNCRVRQLLEDNSQTQALALNESLGPPHTDNSGGGVRLF